MNTEQAERIIQSDELMGKLEKVMADLRAASKMAQEERRSGRANGDAHTMQLKLATIVERTAGELVRTLRGES